jgi:uncharacterized membrane protein YgdD (TMEM256/DUF423 family)
MTTRTKDAITVAVILIAGIAVFVGDLHRTILQAVWPVLIAYFDYLFS